MEKLNLGNKCVGPGCPPYVIAEIGSNHNGDMALCRQLIDSAKSAGADAVKFQSWSEASLISQAEYGRNIEYSDKKRHFGSLLEMVRKYQFTPEQHGEIFRYCRGQGIAFLSSCFAREEVDLLDSLEVAAFKIASMDINHLRLLDYVAGKHRPVILATGMATLGEIERALAALRRGGSGPVALLHCVSLYPPEPELINLRNLESLQSVFEVPVGFSDHTLGTAVPIAAIALGACIIEKHFTLDKNLDGWDHAISADAAELAYIVREGNCVFQALGSRTRMVSGRELERRKKMRRRLVVTREVRAGQTLAEADIECKRPGTGIHPDEIAYVLKRSLRRNLQVGDELEWEDLL